MTNIKSALHIAAEKLAFLTDAELEAEYLLVFVLNKTRAYLRAFAEMTLTTTQENHFYEVLQRRMQGEPLAYITGTKEFWNLTLTVTPDVLIPRPETELLVEKTLQLLSADEVCYIADLGTGSGAIALALANERPHWQITATDNSDAALVIAEKNAHALQLKNINFSLGDWCAALLQQKFNIIISNPPYIAADDQELEKDVQQFEPHTALIAAKNGLEDIEKIATQAKSFLNVGGYLLLEHGARQQAAVQNMLFSAGYTSVEMFTDLSGLPRFILAKS